MFNHSIAADCWRVGTYHFVMIGLFYIVFSPVFVVFFVTFKCCGPIKHKLSLLPNILVIPSSPQNQLFLEAA